MQRSVAEMENQAVTLRMLQTSAPETGHDIDNRSIFVGNVRYSASLEEIQAHFQRCGFINPHKSLARSRSEDRTYAVADRCSRRR
jgi:polyadenylate-binding protein 2